MGQPNPPAKAPPARGPRRFATLGLVLVALTIHVGPLAVLILRSNARTDPSDRASYPFLTLAFVAWWVGFPLMAGLCVRTFWWVQVAWLDTLLLHPIEPNLMGEQAAAFLAFGAFCTAFVGVAIGQGVAGIVRSRNRGS